MAHLSKFEVQVCLIPLLRLYSNSLILGQGQGIFLSRRDMYHAHLHLKLMN